MTLTIAPPSAANRVRSRRPRSEGRPADAPRLRIVRDDYRPTSQVRMPVHPRPPYRSELSVRSPQGARPAPSSRVSPARQVTSARPVAPTRPAPSTRATMPTRGLSTRATPTRAMPPQPVGPVRLTRRGRVVVRIGTVGFALLALVLGVLLINRTAEAGSSSRPVPVVYRVVVPGETLWQIAGEVAPSVDRRDTVARIVELNALSTAGVKAGQRIAVPVEIP